jgi:hypothetical protein
VRTDPRTQAYVAKRRSEGKTDNEIMRCLKRYIGREVYKSLVAGAVGEPLTSENTAKDAAAA